MQANNDFLSPEELADDPVANKDRVLIRCHALADLMTEPKSKTETLSVGAKTYIKTLVRETVFGVRGNIQSKYIKKGLACENDSIALLNDILGMELVKNDERRENRWLTGEPDIVLANSGIDIKTSWSIETFPLLSEDAHEKQYEWQCRGYMMLFNKPRWDVAYCLVDTPDDLCAYEDPYIHKVSHIPANLRVTVCSYERDMELEEKIKQKVEAAQDYYKALLDSVRASRNWFTAPPKPELNQSAKAAFSNVFK